MKQLYILPALLLMGSIAFGQTLDDAVRFSRLSNTGSARMTAMGGAFGALGGDISSLSFNPAGIGVFRKSEIAFTPSLNFSNTESGHGSIGKNSFQVGQLGAVFGFYSPNFNWKGFNFGINYTNLNNFNRQLHQFVENSPTSITNVWADNSFGLAPDRLSNLGSAMAFDTRLIYVGVGEPEYRYYSVLEMEDKETKELVTMPVNQDKRITEEGYQGEYAFSFGTNYKDKLYLGMTIGLQSIFYKTRSTYAELPEEDSPTGLDQFSYNENTKLNGVGTNLKFGVIYRPIPQLRIGASIHTPTWYNMNYDYTSTLASWFLDTDPNQGRDQKEYVQRGEFSFDYNMRTPWRAILSLATVLKQRLILSADYEYVKYTNANYSESSDNHDYYYENQDIKDLLRATHNFRFGSEYRFNSVFSLRAGYNYQASPYENDKENYKIQSVSAGIGLNFGVFYCDAAYTHKYSKGESIFYSGYAPINGEYYYYSAIPVTNRYYNNEARITLGVRF